MRAIAGLLLILLLLPVASAGAPFVADLQDHAGDTVDRQGRPFPAQSADILRFTSEVVDDVVVQRVTVAKTPQPPADWLLVRSWFANSSNGSYHALDLEVTPRPQVESDWVEGWIRDGSYFEPRRVEIEWRVENDTWVFTFNQSEVADATCFDPGVFTRGSGGEDALYPARRRCVQIAEPTPPPPTGTPQVNVNIIDTPPSRAQPTPTVEPPGSRTPTPGVGAAIVLAMVAAAAVLARRR